MKTTTPAFDGWVHGNEDAKEIDLEKLPGFETDALTNRLIGYLERQAQPESESVPFFAALSVQPPHDP